MYKNIYTQIYIYKQNIYTYIQKYIFSYMYKTYILIYVLILYDYYIRKCIFFLILYNSFTFLDWIYIYIYIEECKRII